MLSTPISQPAKDSNLTITVGKSKIVDKNTNKERVYRYSDIPTDEYKWVYNLLYKPIPFDLLHLKLNETLKVKSGWWNGEDWEGLRLKTDEKIIAWKRNHEFEQ